MTTMPVESVLPALANALANSPNAVLVAPPGAGKTTRVPLAFMDEPWLKGQRILMLEPRRLAARAAARFMAASLGEQVGETIGYRVRSDSRVSSRTRIEVVTEGVLTRMLQNDPTLDGVGIVIFDEYHERSLQADLGLALCLHVQSALRDDLRLLVMSATLDAEPVAALMRNAPIIVCEGRSHPVETRYAERRVEERTEMAVAKAIRRALASDTGDILVFLPGAGEIRKVQSLLEQSDLGPGVRIALLYGLLSQQEQDEAIAPCPAGERKVVLATSIAETSLTVEGVRVVIDSGWMRVPRFSPRTGMTRLETVPVTRASADQRRGRAGRLGPGVCYRLWTEQEHRQLSPHNVPEILASDLAPLALELAVWGIGDPSELRWLDPPPGGAYEQARELLRQMGALDNRGAATRYGRQMAELGIHPRLAHMILKATSLGFGGLACDLAALLGGRDVFRGDPSERDADLRDRLKALRAIGTGGIDTRHRVDVSAVLRVSEDAERWKRTLRIESGGADDVDACGLVLSFAYPDRIAQRRGDGRYLLVNGRGAYIPGAQPLSREPYLVAAELDDAGSESRIVLAAPIAADDIERHWKEQIEVQSSVEWDHSAKTVRARTRVRLGALILKETPLAEPAPDDTVKALLEGIREEGLELLPWNRSSRQLRQRIAFLRRLEPGWPDVSDDALTETLEEWLAPHLYGLKNGDDLRKLDLTAVLAGWLPWDRRKTLDELAPTHIVVPSGSRIAIDYSDPEAPVLAVRIQEMFGMKETPRIAGGRVPLTLHLLSPARRPVQVTQDLASFWRTAYFEVRKDLKGKYPKHHWPDDPLVATPTRRAGQGRFSG